MANQGVGGASWRRSAVVAGERQHASHALQVAMGTLLILDLHLPRDDHRASAPPPVIAARSERSADLPAQVRPGWIPGLRPPTQR